MEQILVSKDSQEHLPKASSPATVQMAWARCHRVSIVDGMLYLDHRKQDPDRHIDEPHRLHILTPLRSRIPQEARDVAVGGILGAAKTYMVVRQRIFWPGMWKEVQDYTKGYETFARVNQRAGKVVGLLKPLPVAQGRWEPMGVDFGTDLPTSFRGNDCIVIFVDHFLKRVHWMPCTKTIDAAEFAHLFLEAIIPLHGVPREIVSDRDTHFTSDFWVEVSKRLQTQLLMSTVFHPQTEWLSEISNEQVTRYLQAFTTHHQNQWDTMLRFAEYAYNTSTHSSTN